MHRIVKQNRWNKYIQTEGLFKKWRNCVGVSIKCSKRIIIHDVLFDLDYVFKELPIVKPTRMLSV